MVPLPPRWARGALCWPPCSRRAGYRTRTVWGRQLRWHRRRWLGTAFARSVVPARGRREPCRRLAAFRARHPVLLVVTGLPGAPPRGAAPALASAANGSKLGRPRLITTHEGEAARSGALPGVVSRAPGLQAGEPPQPAAPSAWRAAGRCSPAPSVPAHPRSGLPGTAACQAPGTMTRHRAGHWWPFSWTRG